MSKQAMKGEGWEGRWDMWIETPVGNFAKRIKLVEVCISICTSHTSSGTPESLFKVGD